MGPAIWRTALWLLVCVRVTALLGNQSAPPSNNAADLKSLTLEQLAEIEVTSPTKSPVEASRSPVAIYVITSEDIRRSGAPNIPEALRLAPGVEVARIDSNKWSIGIRGFSTRLSRSVLVVIDGRTVYTPLFAGTYWEVQDTVMEDIDRIEVIRGPGGTIWGPNAVDGVINVITKPASETRGTLAKVGGGNEEQGFATIRYGGSVGANVNYRIYAKGFTRGPEYHPDRRNFDDWRASQGGFRVDWTGDGGKAFTVQGDLYAEEAGERVNATTYNPPGTSTIDANANLSGGNIVARWSRTRPNGDTTQIQAYYDRTNRYEPNLAERRNTFDLDFIERVSVPARQTLSWGLGARVSPIDSPMVVSGLTFLPTRRTDYLVTAFLQDEIRLIENRLELTMGTKLLRTNFTGAGLEPSVRLLWTPAQRQTFWAAYTHALRTPSDAEENFTLTGFVQFLPDGTPFFARFDPNKHFAPEQMNGYEVGFRQLITRQVFVDVAGFFNHYHDLFSEDFQGPEFFEDAPAPPHLLLPAQFRNGLIADTSGGEIAPEWRPTGYLRLRGAYSYLNMNVSKSANSGDIGTGPGIERSSPRHQVMAQADVDMGKRFELDLIYRYVGVLVGQRAPAYSTGDARFGWRMGRRFELSLVGRNLFQPWHAEYGGDPGPVVGIRRSGYLRLTWTM